MEHNKMHTEHRVWREEHKRWQDDMTQIGREQKDMIFILGQIEKAITGHKANLWELEKKVAKHEAVISDHEEHLEGDFDRHVEEQGLQREYRAGFNDLLQKHQHLLTNLKDLQLFISKSH